MFNCSAHNAEMTSGKVRLLPAASTEMLEPHWHTVPEPRCHLAGFCRQRPQPAAWVLLPGQPDSGAPACGQPSVGPLRWRCSRLAAALGKGRAPSHHLVPSAGLAAGGHSPAAEPVSDHQIACHTSGRLPACIAAALCFWMDTMSGGHNTTKVNCMSVQSWAAMSSAQRYPMHRDTPCTGTRQARLMNSHSCGCQGEGRCLQIEGDMQPSPQSFMPILPFCHTPSSSSAPLQRPGSVNCAEAAMSCMMPDC